MHRASALLGILCLLCVTSTTGAEPQQGVFVQQETNVTNASSYLEPWETSNGLFGIMVTTIGFMGLLLYICCANHGQGNDATVANSSTEDGEIHVMSPTPSRRSSLSGAAASLPPLLGSRAVRWFDNATAIKNEIEAALRNDFTRMPDVQALVDQNLERLESFPRILFQNVSTMSKGAIRRLAAIPSVERVLLRYFKDNSAFQQSIQTGTADGLTFPDILAEFLSQYPELKLPESVALNLATLPDMRERLSQWTASVGEFRTSALEVVAANVSKMSDLRQLVAARLPRLPSLQQTLQHYYLKRKPRLRSYEEAPEYVCDNEFIRHGYRPELVTYQRCVDSLFYLHNESGNIYTHLVGAVLFVVFMVYAGSFYYPKHTNEDRILFFVFWTTAVMCLMFSAIFHTILSHSKEVQHKAAKLDYGGIVFLILGSVESVIYFTFYCHRDLRIIYMSLTLVFGALTAWVTWHPKFDGKNKKHIRVLLFVILSATAFLPVAHFAMIYGMEHTLTVIDVFWLFGISCPLYLIGAAVFVLKVPERFFPGRFDYFFHSHQLWHIFVMSAAYAHYVCVHNMMHYWLHNQCSVETAALMKDMLAHSLDGT
eukprot:m.27569 g.27569  ORF g.27569 m.27569 type:complete len:598 (-) comp8943_c0_seq1:650-2443(-)